MNSKSDVDEPEVVGGLEWKTGQPYAGIYTDQRKRETDTNRQHTVHRINVFVCVYLFGELELLETLFPFELWPKQLSVAERCLRWEISV